jgi:hypothetical protein
MTKKESFTTLDTDGLHRREQPGGRLRLQERNLSSAKPPRPRLPSRQRARAEAAGGHQAASPAGAARGHHRVVPQRPQVQPQEQAEVSCRAPSRLVESHLTD